MSPELWRRFTASSLFWPVAALVLWMGVWPKPFIDVMHASVTDLLTHVSRSKL